MRDDAAPMTGSLSQTRGRRNQLSIRWNTFRMRLGARIMGDEIWGVITTLWVIRDRALRAVNAEGRVTLGECEALADVLYRPTPGNWKISVSRVALSPADDGGAR